MQNFLKCLEIFLENRKWKVLSSFLDPRCFTEWTVWHPHSHPSLTMTIAMEKMKSNTCHLTGTASMDFWWRFGGLEVDASPNFPRLNFGIAYSL